MSGRPAPDLPLAELLRRHRERARMTQEELADRAGLSVRTVRGVETGRVPRPHRESVRLLARALGLSSAQRDELEQAAIAPYWEGVAPRPPPRTARTAGPSQLPPDVADFTGRTAIVAEVRSLLLRNPETALPVVAVAGRGGVGKTALAIHVAHRARSRFPDGQLYVNLRGVGAEPLAPTEVLGRFLRALGVEGGALPSDPDERRDLYRSLLADRRTLVVLDNAADEAQVRPLLPGGAGCGVLVTSRRRLLGLEGARHLELDALDHLEALALLRAIAGTERTSADPAAADAVVRYCGHLPLAVRIAGARLCAPATRSAAWLAARLADERRRLDELTAGDLEVRASAALSYSSLGTHAARAFRLLGLLDAHNVAAWVPAALLDDRPDTAQRILDELVDTHLLDRIGPDAAGQPRYRFHDLLRLYARERAEDEEEPPAAAAALTRALGGWLALAERAEQGLPDISNAFGGGAAPRWMPPTALVERLLDDPLAWFESERQALTSAVLQACALGHDELAWELAAAQVTFFRLRSLWEPWRRTHRAALAACHAAGNRRGEAVMLLGLGRATVDPGEYTARREMLEAALADFRAIGDRNGEARSLHELAAVLALLEHHEQALAHAEEARRLAVAIGDGNVEADVTLISGRALRELGRLPEARTILRELADRSRGMGAARAEAQALWQLAAVERAAGDLDVADGLLERCLDIVRALGDGFGEARLLMDLADLRAQRGQLGEAAEALERSIEISEQVGAQRFADSARTTLDRLEPRRHRARPGA